MPALPLPPDAQIDLALLAAFAWFAWVGAVTPGPNCALALSTAVNFGPRRVLPHMLGVAIGFSAMLAAALAGAHGLFLALPWLAQVLKWFGVAWLAWMGVQLARSRQLADGTSARPPRVDGGAEPWTKSCSPRFARPPWVRPWWAASSTASRRS